MRQVEGERGLDVLMNRLVGKEREYLRALVMFFDEFPLSDGEHLTAAVVGGILNKPRTKDIDLFVCLNGDNFNLMKLLEMVVGEGIERRFWKFLKRRFIETGLAKYGAVRGTEIADSVTQSTVNCWYIPRRPEKSVVEPGKRPVHLIVYQSDDNELGKSGPVGERSYVVLVRR